MTAALLNTHGRVPAGILQSWVYMAGSPIIHVWLHFTLEKLWLWSWCGVRECRGRHLSDIPQTWLNWGAQALS